MTSPHWTDRELRRAKLMREVRMTYAAIGEQLGKSSESVRKKLQKETRAKLAAARPKGARRCLKCREAFESKGAHNRVCPSCKDTETWRAGIDGMLVRMGVGE